MFRTYLFKRLYVQKVIYSEGLIFRRSYVQKVLYSEGPMFRRSYVQNIFVQKVLYSEGSMFRRSLVSIVGSLRDREVACSASDRQGSNFESCVWRTVSSQSSHHPQEVLLAQFSLYVHKGGLKPDSFHFRRSFIQMYSGDPIFRKFFV